MDYKARHEGFVSGLLGGSISEIYATSLALPLALMAYIACAGGAPSRQTIGLLDFGLNWVVALAALTVYSGRIAWLLGGLIAIYALNAFGAKPQNKTKADKPSFLARKPAITAYRASLMIVTITAILAVDFQIFPRRFAKVETWGTSLMDLGVGSFVFSSGVVSARAEISSQMSNARPGAWRSLVAAVKTGSQLLALGLVRLVIVKFVSYQEHVSEYGVHWNFFVTLGLLPVATWLVNAVQGAIRRPPTLVVGLVIGFAHELALKNTGFQEWALIAPRVSLVSQNKEGLTSFVGYLAIFLVGQSVGLYVLPTQLGSTSSLFYPASTAADPRESSDKAEARVIRALFTTSAGMHGLFYVLRIATEPSRRLANLPYIIWICGYNTCFLALYLLVFRHHPATQPPSLEAVNKHSQVVFLAANLATGLVNTVMRTLDQSAGVSLIVLLAYQGLIFALALWLNRFRDQDR